MDEQGRFFDPQEMARRGRIGAHVVLSRHDPRRLTEKARATYRASFEVLVDPEGVLSTEERSRRAEHARRAHYTRLARLAALARSAKAKSTTRRR
jgi:hypothetical protein